MFLADDVARTGVTTGTLPLVDDLLAQRLETASGGSDVNAQTPLFIEKSLSHASDSGDVDYTEIIFNRGRIRTHCGQ